MHAPLCVLSLFWERLNSTTNTLYCDANEMLMTHSLSPSSWVQDTRLKYKTKVGKSTLVVKQHVPGGKWALVPNPGACWSSPRCKLLHLGLPQ